MTIPFLDLFKKLTGRFGAETTAEAPTRPTSRVIRPKKPEAERLSKTVMPNATRSFSAPDPFKSAATTAATPRSSMPLELGARKITTSSATARPTQLPPALARALEPKVERAISLKIADLIEVVPAGFIKPVEILDTNAVVSLKASEIEKGMPDKHPMISLPSLYQQVPEIFVRSVRPDDQTRVELPYQKVLEQFQSAHVRVDQVRDPVASHVDTPILKATIEDSHRFGTKIEPIETSAMPPVPVKHATAASIAAAEPEAMPVAPATPARSTSSGQRVISLHAPELAPKGKSSAPTSTAPELKIPFEVSSKEVSPNGTGASASERVPASSGPPVPTPLPFTPKLEKIPLNLTGSPIAAPIATKASEPATEGFVEDAEIPEVTLKMSAEPAAATPDAPPSRIEPSADTPLISLSLKALLQGLPEFQLHGDATTVADDARIKFPLVLIESQLASGRVSIAPEAFQAALPEQYRALFQIDVAKTPVALPLEEVLKNLPAMILKLRDDQEHVALEKDFETPFSLKAKEDERRFSAKAEPLKPTAAPSKETEIEPKTAVAHETAKPAVEKIDAKEVIAQASALAGVKACALTFSDGLSLAGELPEDVEADGLCAMAPSTMERIAQHVRETKLGQLVAMTLYTNNSAVSFFACSNICLTALHEKSLDPEIRKRLAELTEKLSKTYAQPEKLNVDH